MLSVILGLFSSPQAIIALIITVLGGILGVKSWVGGKKARKNERIIAVLKGKEGVAKKTVKVNKDITDMIKEIEDEKEPNRVLEHLNRIRPNRKPE